MYAELAAQRGLGYSATRWTGSQIWEDVKALPERVVLWSNMPDAIQALQGRPARRLPDSLDRTAHDRQSPHPRRSEQVARLEKSLVEESALVVVFREASSARWMIITESELCEALPLVKLADRTDAAIYAHERARRIQELAQWSEGRVAPREGVDPGAEP